MRLFEATVTLFLLTINLYVTSSQQHVRAEPVADVLFLVDGSQNMGLQGFKHTRALILKIVSKLKVGMDESRIGLAQYSDDQHVEFLFNTFQTKKDVLNYIKKKFQYKGGSSLKTGHALDLLHKTFFIASAGSRKNKGIPQIAIIITSAPSQDNVESYSTSLRNYGVIAISIGVKNSDLSELRKIAYLESPPFVFKMNTFVGFTGLTGNLTKTIQNIHEAVKLKEIELPTECTYPWLADIVFLVSESSRIGNSDFQNIRNFLVKVIAAMDVGAERIQIGLARYSNVTKADFFLNTFSNKTDIIKYLKEIIYSGGVTNTGAAIDFIRHNYFIERAGSRIEQGIPQIAIVITAEDSKDDVAAPAAELQRAGVNVYALGIKNVSYAELENIASSPPEHFAMTIRNLEDIERYILKKICIAIYSQFSETQSQDYITRGCIEAEDVDVFFLVEGSDAIKPADFNDAKNFIRAMVNLLNVGPNKVRIGVVQYASTPQTEISIDQYTSKSSLDIAIKNICVMGGDAKTGHALNYMKNVFNQAVHGRETKAQQVLVTIGVGNSLDNAKDPAADLRHNGIDIYAIGRNYSELLLIGGSRKRVFQISNFGTLKHFNKQAAQDLCSDKVCNNLDMTDIIFLIDGSTSINESNFNKIKQFVADLVDKIDIDGVQVGAVQFSTKPHLEFQLDKFTEKTELMKGIKSITRKTGDTYTGLALNFTADYFDQPKGGRPGVLKYLILITDGDAHDSVNEPAKVIRDRGITVLAIGIGIPPNSTTDILMNIGGSQDNIYNVNNFDNLEKILSKIVFKICKPTDCKRMEVADIIFVIDGSSSITAPLFDSMKDFMINLVNQSEVETDRVQFGAVLYDDNPQTKFQLDEFTSKTKIRDAIIGMELKGGDTYTARALNHAKKLLDSERGGRKLRGVPQFLIVITGGGARDKSNLPAEAEAIRDNDIDILAIGVNGAKEDELLKIGGWNDKWFYVQSFDGLKSLPKNISKTLCNKIKPACRKADIVFLIDGSESITDVQFDAIKEFLKEVVNLFAVSREEVQIGIAQFSKQQQTEIYLNESDSQTTLLGKIEKINQLKEGTYIGAALTFVKELFEPSAGSRKLDAVPQYLFLITDGDSRDPVGGPAKDLKQESIKIIAFNVGKLNAHQLRIITGDDENIVKVPDFNLIKVKRRVARDVCSDSSAGDCIIDIAVGFDLPGWFGSQNIFTGQQKLQLKLEEIVQRITSASDISCVSGSQPMSRVAFYIQSETGQVIFETKFEKYSPEIINNLMAIRTAAKIDFNVEYLESLWNKFEETTSKAKVILIFTDGLDDTKERFIKTAKRLSEKEVHALITVALEGALNVDDIPLVEFGRRFGYKQQLSIEMEDIGSALHRQINAVMEKECCNVFCKCIGEPGAQGPPGRKGKKGNAGAKGFLGYQGEEGGPGERGPLGTNGTRGNEGCAGPRGPKGKAGYPGEKGIDGYHGIDGIIGEQGNYGVPGAPGEKGNSGNPGRKGQKGDVGERGIPGLRGDRGESGINNNTRGPKGERGDLGLLGDPGEDGDPGKRGGAGNTGLHGHRGPPGKKGQKGKTGKRSRRGERGNRGPQGISGPSGSQGPKGELGARGWQGLPGSPGHKGIDGILGLTGQNGDPGNPGDKGVRGPSGPRGLTGMDGRDGFGPQGSKGKKGDGGSLGNPGQKGEDGKSGQSGEQGPQGMRGNRGSAGDPGDPGEPGEFGFLGLKGPRGPSGPPYRPCDLISMVRTNCPCCSQRRGECPAYPTELAFALDMSADVTPLIFERMKGIVINLLQNINIAENNCPIGARVAVLTYNNVARPFIRFSDFKKKQLLLKELEELAHERSTRRRNIGIGMQFVARNTFKRVRNGVLVKKIAVFITNGGSKDTNTIATAASQFSASGIIPVIISFKDIPEVERAFKVDTVKVVVLPSQQQDSEELLHRLLLCTLCFDKCEPYDLCLGDTQPSPLPVNLEIAFVVDDLQQMETAQSETVQHFLNSMLNTFLSSTEPKASDLHPRVALMQHTPSYTPRYGKDPFNLEFGILDYTTKTLKKRHIQDSFSQLEGSSGIGSTIEWSLKNFFLNATNQQGYHKVIFTIFSGEASIDEKKLLEISQEAKCKGFAIFTLVLGEVTNVTDLEEFVSFPFDQHLVHLDKALEVEMEYAQKFAVAFLKNLATGINSYPPPDLVKKCRGIKSQDTVKEAETKPSPDLELVVIMDDSEEPQSYTNNYDECALNQDEGDCNNYSIKWFFNNKEKGCARFWYGGCGGNKNRFDTQQECEALCLKPAP